MWISAAIPSRIAPTQLKRSPSVLHDVDISEMDDCFVILLSVRLGKHNTRIDYLRNGAVLSSENEICRNDIIIKLDTLP